MEEEFPSFQEPVGLKIDRRATFMHRCTRPYSIHTCTPYIYMHTYDIRAYARMYVRMHVASVHLRHTYRHKEQETDRGRDRGTRHKVRPSIVMPRCKHPMGMTTTNTIRSNWIRNCVRKFVSVSVANVLRADRVPATAANAALTADLRAAAQRQPDPPPGPLQSRRHQGGG